MFDYLDQSIRNGYIFISTGKVRPSLKVCLCHDSYISLGHFCFCLRSQKIRRLHLVTRSGDILLPAIPKAAMDKMLRAATCVVEGDVHDIGKNIVKTMLTAGGFDVIDLGKDTPIETIIDSVEKNNLNVLCMSTLMTPTMDGMKAAIDGLVENGNRSKVKICIGGPPTSPAFAEEIGADHRDNNAQDCVGWLKGVL